MVGLSNLLYGQYVTKIKRNLNDIDMTFFARPDLSNEQFKQLSGSTLTLSGITQISSEDGLQLINSGGTYSSISATVGFPGTHVLTLQPDGSIKLAESTGSGATTVYLGASPTTVSVGGMPVNTEISGSTFQNILQTILVPTKSGVTTQLPFHTFNIIGPTTYEVGTGVTYTGIITFYRGCHTPTYQAVTGDLISGGTPLASNTPYTYSFNNNSNLPAHSETTSNLTSSTGFTFPMPQGNVSWYTCVTYPEGANLYNSDGDLVSTFSSGITTPVTRTINSIYPYFYGKISSSLQPIGCNRPEINTVRDCIGALNAISGESLNNTCKVVDLSNCTIEIEFNSSADDYFWFAIPSESTSKTCWFINASNQGAIGGAVSAGGNLFPDEVLTEVTSSVWNTVGQSPQTYKVYISNYQSAVSQPMQLCN